MKKTAENPRFAKWFPRCKSGRHTRGEETYVEMRARTDRRMFSPLFFYRRALNESRVDYDDRSVNISM